MANKQRGEVSVSGQDGTAYTLKLGIAAICQLEETLDRPVLSLFEELQTGKMRVTTVREFVKAATTEQTDEQANALLENVGITRMLGAMTESLLATFGVDEKKANANGKADPHAPARQRKRAGAGSSSVPLS